MLLLRELVADAAATVAALAESAEKVRSLKANTAHIGQHQVAERLL